MGITKAILATFGIGITAGVAPFMFMQLLPAMLSPDAALVPPNYLAIILTGVLIGAITSIVFAKNFQRTEPREIFVYALGVPAVLIATTTNISAEFRANKRIADVQEQASTTVLLPPAEPETTDHEPKHLSPTSGDSALVRPLSARWTTTKVSREDGDGSQAETYFVVIGEYTNVTQARADYTKYQRLQLRTERYIQKNLGVYEVRNSAYILAYARYGSDAEARRTYQLLRINDPQVSVRILKYTSTRR